MKQKSLARMLVQILATLPIAQPRAREVARKEGNSKTALFGLMAALIVFLPAVSHAQGWTGNVNAFLGSKTLDEDDWKPLEDHTEVGVLVDFKRATWPVSIAIDFLRSEADDAIFDPLTGLTVNMAAETTELDFGLRKIWDQNAKATPYIGGGLALISAEVSAEVFGINVSADDDAEGFWISGGVYWTLSESFNIGLDLRYSQADVTLLGFDGEAGGAHAGLVLGYHW